MPITSLAPKRPTLLSVDSHGTLYWLQETPAGDDILFAAGSAEIPAATPVTTRRVLEALGAPNGTGTFHSICAANDGSLYFYFDGGQDNKIVACIGRLTPAHKQLEIVADTDRLMQISDMHEAIDLARGTLLHTDHFIWLWLRNQDHAAVLSFNPLAATNRTIDLSRPFRAARAMSGELKLTGAKSSMIPGPGDTLRYFDYNYGKLYKIERTGYASEGVSLEAIPRDAAIPTVDANEQLYFLVSNDAAPRNPTGEFATGDSYPLLIVLDSKGQTRTLQRPQMTAPTTLNLLSIHPEQLLADREPLSWITYDPPTGLLLRMKLNRLPDRDPTN